MATEIERTFLVAGDAWRDHVTGSSDLVQGYLHAGGNVSIRVRLRDDDAVLTVKRGGDHLRREETEVPLPVASARRLLDEATVGRVIRKRRHLVPLGALTAEVDVFEGGHAGLVLADVELDHADQDVPDRDWLGREVTADRRYSNASLATADVLPPW